MGTKRIKIIPDRIFHKLWDRAREFDSLSGYMEATINSLSSDFIDFRKYDIDYVASCDLLQYIYHSANKSISTLISEIGISNAALSHRFCIPIKTVESWKSGKTDCPGYVKLMIMEEFSIPYLPKYIYTDSLEKKRIKHTSIESKSQVSSKIVEPVPSILNSDSSISSVSDTSPDTDFDFSDIDAYLDSLDKKHDFSFKDFEKDDSDVRSLLDRTSYLSNHIKK